MPGTVTGWANLVKGSTLPVDSRSVPLSGSAIVGTAQADLGAAAAYPAQFQMNTATFSGQARTTFGSGKDIGALERMSN